MGNGGLGEGGICGKGDLLECDIEMFLCIGRGLGSLLASQRQHKYEAC